MGLGEVRTVRVGEMTQTWRQYATWKS